MPAHLYTLTSQLLKEIYNSVHVHGRSMYNREYLAPQICSMNNRFYSEAKLPWSYDYPLANHIATNKSSANREMPLFSRLYPSFGSLRKIFPPRGLKYSLYLSLRIVRLSSSPLRLSKMDHILGRNFAQGL